MGEIPLNKRFLKIRPSARMKNVVNSALLLVALVLGLSREATAQSSFFESKTIRLIVGFSPGGISDLWGRALARAMSQTLPGKPNIILQNMPGAGSMTAANYIYSVAKPDGLTLGFVTPGLYFNQLTEMKEAQFDWAKFTWIGSPERTVRIIYGRADMSHRTLEDLRNAAEAPRCGATALGTVGHYFPRLIEEVAGVRFNIVTGYPGAAEIDLAMQKSEVLCRAGSLEGYFGSEPTRSWAKSGFTRVLVHGSPKRDPRLPDVPTVNDILDKRKAPEATRRLATVLMAPDAIGRPLIAPPGLVAEHVATLRDGFVKALGEAEFVAEARKRNWEIEPVSGQELEAIAKKVVVQPPEVVERMKKILAN
jgi:tripartite-type tricarboxylate transporter receptor subunit TctC